MLEDEKAKFAMLLGIYGVFDDHAWQDDKSLAVIRSMKPVWEPGAPCFQRTTSKKGSGMIISVPNCNWRCLRSWRLLDLIMTMVKIVGWRWTGTEMMYAKSLGKNAIRCDFYVDISVIWLDKIHFHPKSLEFYYRFVGGALD